jgi:hypothetical protein
MRRLFSILLLIPFCACAQKKISNQSLPEFLFKPILEKTETEICVFWGEPSSWSIPDRHNVSWEKNEDGRRYLMRVIFQVNGNQKKASEFLILKRHIKKQLNEKWTQEEAKELATAHADGRGFEVNPTDKNPVIEYRGHLTADKKYYYWIYDKGRQFRMFFRGSGASPNLGCIPL